MSDINVLKAKKQIEIIRERLCKAYSLPYEERKNFRAEIYSLETKRLYFQAVIDANGKPFDEIECERELNTTYRALSTKYKDIDIPALSTKYKSTADDIVKMTEQIDIAFQDKNLVNFKYAIARMKLDYQTIANAEEIDKYLGAGFEIVEDAHGVIEWASDGKRELKKEPEPEYKEPETEQLKMI